MWLAASFSGRRRPGGPSRAPPPLAGAGTLTGDCRRRRRGGCRGQARPGSGLAGRVTKQAHKGFLRILPSAVRFQALEAPLPTYLRCPQALLFNFLLLQRASTAQTPPCLLTTPSRCGVLHLSNRAPLGAALLPPAHPARALAPIGAIWVFAPPWGEGLLRAPSNHSRMRVVAPAVHPQMPPRPSPPAPSWPWCTDRPTRANGGRAGRQSQPQWQRRRAIPAGTLT